MKNSLIQNFGRVSIALLMLFFFTGCKKEKGPAGMQGPKGTANVIYSDWITVEDSDWIHVTDNSWKFEIDAPNITQEIIDKGDFRVYARYNGYLRALPFNDISENDGSARTYDYYYNTYNPGKITIRAYSSLHAITSLFTLEFRYIIIPGGTHGKPMISSPDLSDYNAVCDYYNIEK